MIYMHSGEQKMPKWCGEPNDLRLVPGEQKIFSDSLFNETEWSLYASVNLPSLVQACHLVGAKPLSEPMLEDC